ncbi:MAG TPA: YbaB/EbfC family nucleoid-associated protein [Candidatus Woesebacteria bacterium]|jgi:DNA-binding protein YbaB|nr:YbaB/EbfC family nucleoid-associated protein [Candidatus Woesebacteria bacterium]HNQ16614.1 YbaB/EbfC family nucleoid-associated protein [Candidatus Woesebacteria bacterium]HNS65764.1 YbaB/EbfC family nucleoid-associated protein [Candidatus Woesebacteria bacterium]
MQNPLKALGDLNSLRQQAKQMQDELGKEEIVIEKGDIRVVITGDQKIKQFSVQGISSEDAIAVLNEAIKKSQELAAKKLQSMTGGLGGLLGKMGQ